MKKSMLALAVLGAFAGAASAQSSVTLYGRAEANATYSTPGDNVNDGDSIWRMDDGGRTSGIGGSRWGLRGTEDLGSGLKGIFQLESGFRLDDGTQAGSGGRFFDRHAWVGLQSDSLGTVKLGRQETLTRLTNSGFVDASGIGELKVDEGITVGDGARPLFQTFGQRVDNAVTYTTPSFAGFTVSGIVAAGEGAAARHQGLSAAYKNGPLAVALTYEMYDGFGDTYNKVGTLGANYNFGFMSLFAGYQNTTDFGGAGAAPTGADGSVEDHQAANIGVLVPLGQFAIRAQYTRAEYDFVGGGDAYAEKYGASVRYALSKRTTLYSAITQRAGDDEDDFAVQREITLLGVAHTF